MLPGDWPAVAAIYAEGIATGHATLETAVPAYEAWDAARLADPRLVARANGVVARLGGSRARIHAATSTAASRRR